ncbi:MAG: mechanosensitive ion channel family protein [Candidatus Aminicenantes bacterium]|nr:mechanosensitive ion channel family protein [Candidatus Aminicenantes bacterium]
MQFETSFVKGILFPALIVLFSVFAGWMLQFVISGFLHRKAQKTVARWDDVLIRSFRGVVLVWASLVGLAVALSLMDLRAEAYFILSRAIVLAAILSVTVWAARTASGFMDLYITRVAGVPSTIFRNIAVILVGLVGFLVILDELGIAIAPIVTALGVGGLAIALALQDTLANLFAGLHILMSRNVRTGDYIRLATGEEGTVTDITWRNTTLRELENNLVIIPNKKLADSTLRNYSLPEKPLALLVDLKLGYGADLRRAEAVIVEEARATLREVEGGAPDFEPLVRFNLLGDYNIGATVILRVAEFAQQFRVKHEFIKRLRARFAAEGIPEPFPVVVKK